MISFIIGLIIGIVLSNNGDKKCSCTKNKGYQPTMDDTNSSNPPTEIPS